MITDTLSLRSCTLRPLCFADAATLAEHADNPDIACNLRDRFPSPYRKADAVAFIQMAAIAERDVHLAIEVGGDAVGVIGIRFRDDVHRFSAEVGYWLGASHWGKGIATEALAALSIHAFATTDVLRLDALVYTGNERSARVLEKAGYAFEARLASFVVKNGRVLDALLYARIRR